MEVSDRRKPRVGSSRVTFSFAAALEALRAPFKSRRIASGRAISLRFAHRSMALIVSVGSRTLINGPAFVPGQAFLDWTVFFGIADPLLNRVFEGYIRQPIVRHKRSSDYRRVGLSEAALCSALDPALNLAVEPSPPRDRCRKPSERREGKSARSSRSGLSCRPRAKYSPTARRRPTSPEGRQSGRPRPRTRIYCSGKGAEASLAQRQRNLPHRIFASARRGRSGSRQVRLWLSSGKIRCHRIEKLEVRARGPMRVGARGDPRVTFRLGTQLLVSPWHVQRLCQVHIAIAPSLRPLRSTTNR